MPFYLASFAILLLWPLSEPLQSLQPLIWLLVAIFFSRSSSLTSYNKPLQQQALLLQLTSPIPSSVPGFWQVLVPYLLEPSKHSLLLCRLHSATSLKNISILPSSNLSWEYSRFCHTLSAVRIPWDSSIMALKACDLIFAKTLLYCLNPEIPQGTKHEIPVYIYLWKNFVLSLMPLHQISTIWYSFCMVFNKLVTHKRRLCRKLQH